MPGHRASTRGAWTQNGSNARARGVVEDGRRPVIAKRGRSGQFALSHFREAERSMSVFNHSNDRRRDEHEIRSSTTTDQPETPYITTEVSRRLDTR
jgi:hypothetical protein